MKVGRFVLGLVGSALFATAAVAADLPPAPTVVAPPPPMAAPAFDWGGVYFGAYAATIGAPLEIGAHVGFNVVRGRAVLGLEAGGGVIPAGPVFTAFAKARAGFVVGERVLLYGMTAINAIFVGPAQVFWVAGGGAEVALSDRFSLFAEAGVLGVFNPFGCCGLSVKGGVNIHR